MSKNGVRQSAASAFIRPSRARKNFDVIINAQATKLITSKNRVTGVEYIKVSRQTQNDWNLVEHDIKYGSYVWNTSQDGIQRRVYAKREVIVSGGVVNTPQLLLLSGIGPKEQLAALKIPVVLDLPGVGKNLHNHVSYSIDFTLPEIKTSGYTPDTMALYLYNQTGPMSSSGLAQVTAILPSEYTTPDYPDIQIFFSGYQASCRYNGDVDLASYGEERAIRFTAVNLHPQSRGKLSK